MRSAAAEPPRIHGPPERGACVAARSSCPVRGLPGARRDGHDSGTVSWTRMSHRMHSRSVLDASSASCCCGASLRRPAAALDASAAHLLPSSNRPTASMPTVSPTGRSLNWSISNFRRKCSCRFPCCLPHLCCCRRHDASAPGYASNFSATITRAIFGEAADWRNSAETDTYSNSVHLDLLTSVKKRNYMSSYY